MNLMSCKRWSAVESLLMRLGSMSRKFYLSEQVDMLFARWTTVILFMSFAARLYTMCAIILSSNNHLLVQISPNRIMCTRGSGRGTASSSGAIVPNFGWHCNIPDWLVL